MQDTKVGEWGCADIIPKDVVHPNSMVPSIVWFWMASSKMVSSLVGRTINGQEIRGTRLGDTMASNGRAVYCHPAANATNPESRMKSLRLHPLGNGIIGGITA